MIKLSLILLFLLGGCYKYKEANPLAIPPIAKDELKVTTENKTKDNVNEKNR